MRRIPKDPNAVLDYFVDWGLWLAAGDEIDTSQWIISPAVGLAVQSEEKTTTRATVWLAGGAAGASYTVTNRITTLQGRTDDRSLVIAVRER